MISRGVGRGGSKGSDEPLFQTRLILKNIAIVILPLIILLNITTLKPTEGQELARVHQ